MKKNQRISTLDTLTSLRFAKPILEELDSYISRNISGRRNRSQAVNRIVSDFLRREKALEHTHKSGYLKGMGRTPGVEDIIKAIKNKGFEKEITRADIVETIKGTRGKDPRTVKNWFRNLEESEFIKENENVHVNYKQAIYTLNWPAVDESLWPDSIRNNGGTEKEDH